MGKRYGKTPFLLDPLRAIRQTWGHTQTHATTLQASVFSAPMWVERPCSRYLPDASLHVGHVGLDRLLAHVPVRGGLRVKFGTGAGGHRHTVRDLYRWMTSSVKSVSM